MTSLPWGWILFGAIALAVIATLLRSRAEARSAPPYPDNYAGNRADNYGAPSAGDWGRQPVQPAQPGMGGNIMGGLATGLAVGAGVVVAEEIGRRMVGGHEQHNLGAGATGPVASPQSDSSLANDAGIGGIDRLAGGDADAWDDGGSFGGSGDDGGGGWDS
jgi:uncharacterized protein